MIYLICAILCSSCITIVLKAGNDVCKNRYGMLTVNYIACILMALIFMPKDTVQYFDFNNNFVLLLGLINGFLFVICMVYNQINVDKNGAIMTATFVRLGVIVPTLLSVILFGEKPSLLQVIGILFVGLAFYIMSGKVNKESGNLNIHLVILLILGGITDSMSKIFEQTCPIEYDDIFLFLTFFLAFVICLSICIYKKKFWTKNEAIMGIAMGVPNYLSTLFLIKALTTLPAFIIYPTYSVGSIIVVTSISALFFKEKLSESQLRSMFIILIALFLLNI